MKEGTASERCWFALYTKPHKEYLVRDLLRTKGAEVYLPEITVVNPRRDQRQRKPFFPHYLFARLDPSSSLMTKARWTPGLRCIVCSGDRPLPVPDQVVARIQHRLEEIEPLCPKDAFEKGDVVHVTRGPLEGLDAIFDRQLSPEGRVRVFLHLMNRAVTTDLDAGDLCSAQ